MSSIKLTTPVVGNVNALLLDASSQRCYSNTHWHSADVTGCKSITSLGPGVLRIDTCKLILHRSLGVIPIISEKTGGIAAIVLQIESSDIFSLLVKVEYTLIKLTYMLMQHTHTINHACVNAKCAHVCVCVTM